MQPTEYLVNCTPHEIAIVGGPTLPPSGEVARLDAIEIAASETEFGGAPLADVEFGTLRGVPDPEPGTKFIVSLPCVLARSRWAWWTRRDDLLVPYLEVRDEAGQPVGCRMLARAV